jgi:hypothetical protein
VNDTRTFDLNVARLGPSFKLGIEPTQLKLLNKPLDLKYEFRAVLVQQHNVLAKTNILEALESIKLAFEQALNIS